MNRSLFGLSRNHLCNWDQTHLIHTQLKRPLTNLIQAGKKDGLEITIASAYRSFHRQLNIWNQKALGLRDILDDRGKKINIAELSQQELLFAILRFSAIPGFSRHHFGTDLDIFDQAQIDKNYILKLTHDEFQTDGPFSKLDLWLEENSKHLGFSRPFNSDSGGIAVEPWHISYQSIAKKFLSLQSFVKFKQFVASTPILLKEEILFNSDEIFERFITTHQVL